MYNPETSYGFWLVPGTTRLCPFDRPTHANYAFVQKFACVTPSPVTKSLRVPVPVPVIRRNESLRGQNERDERDSRAGSSDCPVVVPEGHDRHVYPAFVAALPFTPKFVPLKIVSLEQRFYPTHLVESLMFPTPPPLPFFFFFFFFFFVLSAAFLRDDRHA